MVPDNAPKPLLEPRLSARRLITVTGTDRPGLIAAISGVLAQAGADLEDISMTRLSGNFAMIVLARGGDPAHLNAQLTRVGAELGLFIHVEQAVENPQEPEARAFVSAVGPNRVGIVASLSRVLANHGVCIVEMTTRLLEKTEVAVYMVRIEATMPDNWNALEQELADTGRSLGIEVRLEAMERSDL
jgi:glycine cleavage system transcriptional repressor